MILVELRAVQAARGDTYSSAEVLGMIGRAADKIEWLRSPISTLELTELCRALPLFDQRMIYEVVKAFIEIRGNEHAPRRTP